METVVLAVHLLLALALVGIVLIQRSEGGGLGMSGGTGNSFMTSRATGNLLTRTTGILAACFMATSITLAILAGTHKTSSVPQSLETLIEQSAPAVPANDAAPLPAPAADPDRPAAP